MQLRTISTLLYRRTTTRMTIAGLLQIHLCQMLWILHRRSGMAIGLSLRHRLMLRMFCNILRGRLLNCWWLLLQHFCMHRHTWCIDKTTPPHDKSHQANKPRLSAERCGHQIYPISTRSIQQNASIQHTQEMNAAQFFLTNPQFHLTFSQIIFSTLITF